MILNSIGNYVGTAHSLSMRNWTQAMCAFYVLYTTFWCFLSPGPFANDSRAKVFRSAKQWGTSVNVSGMVF